MPYLMKKVYLNKFINSLIRGHEVHAPAFIDGRFAFHRISSADEVRLDLTRPPFSPKKVLFPHEEVLFDYEIGDEVCLTDHLTSGRPSALLGVRACDVRGITILDRYFLSEIRDPYYEARRSSTLIISFTCTSPLNTCFCTLYSGVKPEEGYDLLFTEIGDAYFVETGTEKGEGLVDASSDLFVESSPADEIEAKRRVRYTNEMVGSFHGLPDIDAVRLSNALIDHRDDDYWIRLGDRCLSCGKCNFVCPTCHCFTIEDTLDLRGSSGSRVRRWDACHLAHFTKVAGGITFRQERHSRAEFRLYDKLCYPVRQFGVPACTGCGRCVSACPAHIDIRDVIRHALEVWI